MCLGKVTYDPSLAVGLKSSNAKIEITPVTGGEFDHDIKVNLTVLIWFILRFHISRTFSSHKIMLNDI